MLEEFQEFTDFLLIKGLVIFHLVWIRKMITIRN